jgi:glycosyltransferase involved in cell wall biosynthesis
MMKLNVTISGPFPARDLPSLVSPELASFEMAISSFPEIAELAEMEPFLTAANGSGLVIFAIERGDLTRFLTAHAGNPDLQRLFNDVSIRKVLCTPDAAQHAATGQWHGLFQHCYTRQTPPSVASAAAAAVAAARDAALPRISVLTPSYNCAAFLRTAVESVLAQGYPNLEHIVVDGGSTDGSLEILRSYPHLRWISEKDGGEAEALNKAARMATGEILVWFNADDVFQPEVFQRVAEVIDPAAGRHLVYGKALVINEAGDIVGMRQPIVPVTLPRLLRTFNHLHMYQPAMFFSRALLDDVGPFREDLFFSIDLEFWLRIAAKGYAFHYLDQPLAQTRLIRSGAKSSASWTEQERNWMEVGCAFIHHLTPPEQVAYWKDYYLFRQRAAAQYPGDLPLPGERNALHGLCLALVESARADDLLAVLDHALKLHPGAAELHFITAETVMQMGQPAEARKIFQTALRLQPAQSATYLAPPPIEVTTQVTTEPADLSPAFGPTAQKKALLFFPHNPFPPRTGAHRRFVAMLEAVKELGYAPTLLSSTQFSDTPWKRDELAEVGRQHGLSIHLHDASPADAAHVQARQGGASSEDPLVSGLHTPAGLRQAFRRLREADDSSLVMTNYAYWAGVAPPTDPAFAGCTRVIDTLDLLWLNRRFRDRLATLIPPRPYHPSRAPAALLDPDLFKGLTEAPGADARAEYALYDGFDATVAISPLEAELLGRELHRSQVAYLPMSLPLPVAAERRTTIPVLVAFDNPLNVQGYLVFAARALPRILAANPRFELMVAGALSQQITPLTGVRPLGYVEDLDALYRESGYAICPLFAMTGQPVKVVEAMAHGLPVVVFPGIARLVPPLQHGVTGLVAGSPEEFAEHCLRLSRDLALCQRLGAAARESIVRHGSIESMTRALGELISGVARAATPANPLVPSPRAAGDQGAARMFSDWPVLVNS